MNIKDVNEDGIALDGMDPVAYHLGEPMVGNSQLQYELDGLIYLFVNEENMRSFVQNPGKYTGPLQGKRGERAARERRMLEDKKDDHENNIPTDIREDGEVEMQKFE